MGNEMSYGPLKALFHGRALLANDLWKVTHGRGIEIDVKSTGDHIKPGELGAPEASD